MRQPIATWIRILGGIALTSLIAWLALAPRFDSRFTTLKKLVATGKIGYAASEELVLFRELVTRAALAAQIKDSIVINGLPGDEALHFYLTNSHTREFTGCATGNAVYDAELNAVFVDQSLFRPTELNSIGGVSIFPFMRNREYAFTRTFLTLVLLHELGHRTLHRSPGFFFDGRKSSNFRRIEMEADSFALEALKQGYSHGVLGADSSIIREVSWAGLGDKLKPDESLTAALLFSVAQMSTSLLFTRGSISSLYEDESHPSYGLRITRFANMLATQVSKNPTFDKYIAYFRSKVERVDSLRNLGFIELHSEEAIKGIAFDEDGLTLVDQSWNVSHVPMQDLTENSEKKSISLRSYMVGQVPIQKTPDDLCEIWSLQNGGVFLLSCNHHLFSVHKKVHRVEQYLGSRLDSTLAEITSPSQPAPFIIRDNGSTFSIVRTNKVIRTLNWSSVLSSVRELRQVEQPTTRSITFTGNTGNVAVYGNEGLIGVLVISAMSPFNTQFVPLNINGDIDRTGELAVIGENGKLRFFLAGKKDLHEKVTIWELDPINPPILKATYSPLLNTLSSLPLSGQNVPVHIRKVQTFGPHYIFISLFADAILRYDVRSNTLKLVFYTGPETSISIAHQGTIAFAALNSYKVFILP